MSTSSDWDYPPPPMHDPARPPQDHTGEPVGYNLGDVRFEQPPLPPLQPYRVPTPSPLPSGQAIAGFALSLGGLVTAAVVVTAPLAVIGLVISAIALSRSRRGLASGRGYAIAGVILGILGLAVTLFVILDLMTGSMTAGP
ncbi:MAG TPA: DUF4190 domain-containing protein [Pengzhenrongella sp.]